MAKKIVILNGSPRQKGNTSLLAEAFAEGARSAGHTVMEFFLAGMDIHGCKGCFGGHSREECPCTQHDDMDKIYPAVKGSDEVVLASPLYYWTIVDKKDAPNRKGTKREVGKFLVEICRLHCNKWLKSIFYQIRTQTKPERGREGNGPSGPRRLCAVNSQPP